MTSWYPGQKAQEIADKANNRYEKNLANLKKIEAETNELTKEYGEFQLKIIVNTLKPIIEHMISIGQKVSQKERQLLDKYDFSVQKLKDYQEATIKADNLLMGGVQASVAGAAAYGGALTVATSIGAASTGAAISSLSGAAAWNATLAWFGGGAIAAGGGGMALGVWVLGGITAVPALGVMAFMAKSQGEKALTKAKEYEAQVNKAIAEMDAAKEVVKRISKRIEELKNALDFLSQHSLNILNQLKTGNNKSSTNIESFKQLMLLTQTIVGFLETPILNQEGNLNYETLTILEKYRSYIPEQFSDQQIIICHSCGQKNRIIIKTNAIGDFSCGKCKSHLKTV